MLSNFITVQYCYNYLVDQIPIELLLYSHLPIALIALAFSIFVLVKSKNLAAFLLFITCFVFASWSILDLSAWFAFLGTSSTLFAWSLLDFLGVLMFFFGYYFIYVFISGKDLPKWQKILGIAFLIPTAYISFWGLNISSYDLNTCEAIENGSYTIYAYCAEILFILATLFFIVHSYKKNTNKSDKRRILLSGFGIVIFFTIFFSASFLVWLLAETNAALYAYNYLIYGLFGMPIFLIYLGYIIVKYRAFNIKLIGVQALIVAMVALIGSQFFFIQTNTNRILTAITLVILGIVGINLIRSVKGEIESREKIEKLAKDLEAANNKLQELDQLKSEFLSLATHQIRAPLTAIKGYSSMLLEGDFGVLPKKATESVETIMKSCQNLINIVGDFLNISRIEQGRMTYEKSVFDVGELVKEVANEIKPNILNANLKLELLVPENLNARVNADRSKIKQVIGNVIDNSIKYTLEGSIKVAVAKDSQIVKIAIKDTGVGIDPSEMGKLFNKFSRTKDAGKTNVIGTGLGLYIAKKMVEAHRGDIKVSSDGVGKGTTFIIELPLQL